MVVDQEGVRGRVARHRNWYHRIELAPGLYYRKLDVGTGIWGRGGRPAD